MKSTKKLLIATLLLVLALTAVVSSTFAWFTMQANPQIDNIQVKVTAGEGLRMSFSGDEGTFKSMWTEQEFLEAVDMSLLVLDSVTPSVNEAAFIKNQFQKLNYVNGNPAYYDYVLATKNVDYLSFDIYFEADKDIDVFLELGNVSLEPGHSNNESLDSLRFGFLAYESDHSTPAAFNIFDPRSSSEGDFGSGRFFEKKLIDGSFREMIQTEEGQENKHLKLETGGKFYEMTEIDRKATNDAVTYSQKGTDGISIINVPNNTTRVKVTVFVWIEGWDGDCIDAAKGAVINILLRFVGKAKPE